MIDRVSALITDIFQFHTDRFLTALVCLLFGMFLLCGARLRESKRGNRLFWTGIVVFLVAIGVTAALYSWRMPHGLFGSYYANPVWSDTPYIEMDSYFERGKNGQRVDRFLDFNPNDFNDRYPFSDKPFSVMWQGYAWLPADNMQLRVTSNFGTWLYVDDTLAAGNHRLDFGSPDAAPFLREGWSHNEQWAQDTSLNFVWSTASRSEFYLAVDELTDYEFIFHCLPFNYRVSQPQEVTVSLAGTRIGSVTLKEGWNTYRLPVPRTVLQQAAPGFFRVKFEYAYVTRPSDVESQSNDTRQLAAAFDFALLQKTSVQSEPMLTAPRLSRGLHRITLKAQSKAPNPFIRLAWKRSGDAAEKVIPEDALFPVSLSPEQIQQTFRLEKLGVGIAIALKSAAIVGVLALGRPTFLLFMPGLFLWMLFTPPAQESPRKSRFSLLIERIRRNSVRQCAYWAVVCVTILMVISPFTLRNYYASGQFVLITDAGGWNLWMGNNSHATGHYGFDPAFLHTTAEHMRATGNSYFDEALLFIKEQPADFLRLQWQKCLMFWRGYEIPNLMNYYFIRDHSPLLQFPLVNFVILAPLGFVGMILSVKHWQSRYLLYAFVAAQFLINVLFLTLDRYRIPVVPILSIFAAYTLRWCYRAAVERRIFSVIGIAAILVTLYVAMNYPYAAELYQQRYQRAMPLTQVFRYWDVFHFSAPE